MAAAQHVRCGTPAASAPGNTRSRGTVRSTTTVSGAALAPPVSPCRSPRAPPAPRPTRRRRRSSATTRSALANGRAASWTTTMSARSRMASKPLPHGVLAPRAAGHDAQRLAGHVEVRRSVAARSGGSTTTISSMRGCVGEQPDRPAQDRLPADRQQLLRHARAEARAPAAGGHDGHYAHLSSPTGPSPGPAACSPARARGPRRGR